MLPGVLWWVKYSGHDVKVNHDVITDVVFCSSLKTRIQKQYPNAFKDTVAALDTADQPDLNAPQWCHVFEFSVQCAKKNVYSTNGCSFSAPKGYFLFWLGYSVFYPSERTLADLEM
jgi:hypothetical protein